MLAKDPCNIQSFFVLINQCLNSYAPHLFGESTEYKTTINNERTEPLLACGMTKDPTEFTEIGESDNTHDEVDTEFKKFEKEFRHL